MIKVTPAVLYTVGTVEGCVCDLKIEGEEKTRLSHEYENALVLKQYKLPLPRMITQIYIFLLIEIHLFTMVRYNWYSLGICGNCMNMNEQNNHRIYYISN